MKPDEQSRFDGQVANTYVEVKAGLSGIRHLHAGLMNMAAALANEPQMHGLVVLAGSRVSQDRFLSERAILRQIFLPEIAERLDLVMFEDGHLTDLPPWFGSDPSHGEQLKELVQAEVTLHTNRLPRPCHAYEIFKILVNRWFQGKGPLAINELEDKVGCTYPTVAKALNEMAGDLRRSSSRGVELESFPKQRWAAYLAQGDAVRQTFRFADRSGQPRAAEGLIRRIARLRQSDQTLALGGVAGARAHFPNLDLLGLPRVDLTLHCPKDRVDLTFLARIDPALKPCTEREASPALVIHVLRRRESGFTERDELPLADPVECLLDLHEARLESQAQEFFDHLVRLRLPSKL